LYLHNGKKPYPTKPPGGKMKTYVALLRGINVSGQKKIIMSDLKRCFEDLEFKNVRTYIQSGNVVFACVHSSKDQLSDLIEKKITAQFGFSVSVIIVNAADLENLLKQNPFSHDPGKRPDRFYVTFLTSKPAPENIKKLEATGYSPEEYALQDKYIYLYLPYGSGRAKINNNFFEKILKVPATTRNWNTVNKLLNLMTNN
jgi:uncharacterized protein (DUF1697 family)